MRVAFLILACSCLGWIACKPPLNLGNVAESNARAALGNNCKLFPNTDSTLLLAIEVSDRSRLRALVLNVADGVILFDREFTPGYVQWHTPYEIALLDLPEAMPAHKTLDDFVRIITIQNHKP